ncbi:hypothetical protein ACKKBG_A20765 [Auxenochlorella protothecoides x Auxenochlorella symbiontica]
MPARSSDQSFSVWVPEFQSGPADPTTSSEAGIYIRDSPLAAAVFNLDPASQKPFMSQGPLARNLSTNPNLSPPASPRHDSPRSHDVTLHARRPTWSPPPTQGSVTPARGTPPLSPRIVRVSRQRCPSWPRLSSPDVMQQLGDSAPEPDTLASQSGVQAMGDRRALEGAGLKQGFSLEQRDQLQTSFLPPGVPLAEVDVETTPTPHPSEAAFLLEERRGEECSQLQAPASPPSPPSMPASQEDIGTAPLSNKEPGLQTRRQGAGTSFAARLRSTGLMVAAVLASILAFRAFHPSRLDVDSLLQERLDALSQVEHMGGSLEEALAGNGAALRLLVEEVDRLLKGGGADVFPALASVFGALGQLSAATLAALNSTG